MFNKRAPGNIAATDARRDLPHGLAEDQVSLSPESGVPQSESQITGKTVSRVEDGIVSIGRGTVIIGEINECRTLEIQGRVDGTISTEVLVIHEGGSVKGQVHASNAVVFGDFSGQLEVSGLLDVRGTGRVEGELAYGQLAVAMGGHISGNVFTGADRTMPPLQAANPIIAPPQLAHDAPHRPNLTVLNGHNPSS